VRGLRHGDPRGAQLAGIEVSTGWMAGIRGRAAALVEASRFMDRVRDLLKTAPAVHADETPARRVLPVLSTAAKWSISKLDALRHLFNGNAWMPPGLEPAGQARRYRPVTSCRRRLVDSYEHMTQFWRPIRLSVPRLNGFNASAYVSILRGRARC
jgi:Transposase IS66 family